jgi:hypothetical protein
MGEKLFNWNNLSDNLNAHKSSLIALSQSQVELQLFEPNEVNNGKQILPKISVVRKSFDREMPKIRKEPVRLPMARARILTIPPFI